MSTSGTAGTSGTPLTVTVNDDALAAQAGATAEQLAAEGVAAALAAQRPDLWGPQAESDAAVRLSWTTLYTTSRGLIGEVTELADQLRSEGLTRVVLAGMGGSSLAPEVICRTAGEPLTVLDTTDPGQVREALAGELESTVLVVSSKSGSTVETDSHRRIFEEAFASSGLDPAAHIVVVTDPGSPLQQLAEKRGYRKVFQADPHVGGRYSALTAFGLVPAGLAGADIAALLDEAAAVAGELATDTAANPALLLASALAQAHVAGAEKVVLADADSTITGLEAWAEQLIAESTGKQGIGLLPVTVGETGSPGFSDAGADATTVVIGRGDEAAQLAVSGSLGGQFLLWETAIAICGRLLGINPFDQPDVEAAKQAARDMLQADTSSAASQEPLAEIGAVQIYAGGDWLEPAPQQLGDALRQLLQAAPEGGYLALQAYLDAEADASIAVLRGELARRSRAVRDDEGLAVTFGWGPRFLHSTGQYHKGGHQNGVFCQITGAVPSGEDLDVSDMGYTLAGLQRSQALGDGAVLAGNGRPVLRLHLLERTQGLVELATAVAQLDAGGAAAGAPASEHGR